MNKAGLIFMALVALGTANADAKKFYHYSPTLAILGLDGFGDDECPL